jgi:hypothetical protein
MDLVAIYSSLPYLSNAYDGDSTWSSAVRKWRDSFGVAAFQTRRDIVTDMYIWA